MEGLLPSEEGGSGCPFSGRRSGQASTPRAAPSYRRPFGIFHNPALRSEIAALDAERDCARIVFLLANYEFPFDLSRALELALYHTYGSASVAGLLDRTGEFAKRGQKRYDDTRLLISQFVEAGWQTDLGRRSIAQMNKIHGFFAIPNDDYLFVLWTFIDFPLQWTDEFGWRQFTPHERQAWFNFWIAIGREMGIKDLPADKARYDAFIAAYEAREMVYSDASHRVALATVRVMENWLPAPLRVAVLPIAACLLRPQFLTAAGIKPPPAWLKSTIRSALKLRAWVKRFVSIERYPKLLADALNRTYPDNRYEIETLGPEYAHKS